MDTTPGVNLINQLSFCIRCRMSEYLTDIVLKCLKDKEFEILKCRVQSYNTACNMSGQYSGLQELDQ